MSLGSPHDVLSGNAASLPPPFSKARGSIMKIKHVSVLLQTILNVNTNPEETLSTSILTRLPIGRVMGKYAYVMLLT